MRARRPAFAEAKPLRLRAGRRLRAAVIGVGYFGRFHAAKYASLPNAALAAVVDIDRARAHAVGQEFGCAAHADYRRVIDEVDAVSIATPAGTHFDLACAFLAAGKHVLVEKPIALTVADADEMIALARRAGVVLQVGHQERFLLDRFEPGRIAPEPREIVCRRAGPANGRSADCSVVLDLMIHDLDLVHRLVAGEPERATVARPRRPDAPLDVAEVSLQLNGCVVRLSASRVNPTRERWIRVSGREGAFEIDFVARRFTRVPRAGGKPQPAEFPEDDLLRVEIEDFLAAIRTGRAPRVTGEDGRRALATALMIDHRLGLARAAGGP